jgi:hypothetical protein
MNRRDPPSPRGESVCAAAPRQRFGYLFHYIAGLQEAVGKCVATSMTVQALNENNGRNDGRPEPLLPQSKD